jgi:acetyl-CoA carboxylase biotin carboxyl carrier protein
VKEEIFMEGITQDDVIEILKMLDESNMDEIHLEMGDLKLIARRYAEGKAVQDGITVVSEKAVRPEVMDVDPAPETHTAASVSESDTQKAEAGMGIQEDGLTPIKAPMLGTFYKAPKPGALPFVEEGKVVTEDDTVCIIEVMKLFNTVKAGVRGRIKKVCVEDAQMVEFGQNLFLVDEIPDEKNIEGE